MISPCGSNPVKFSPVSDISCPLVAFRTKIGTCLPLFDSVNVEDFIVGRSTPAAAKSLAVMRYIPDLSIMILYRSPLGKEKKEGFLR